MARPNEDLTVGGDAFVRVRLLDKSVLSGEVSAGNPENRNCGD